MWMDLQAPPITSRGWAGCQVSLALQWAASSTNHFPGFYGWKSSFAPSGGESQNEMKTTCRIVYISLNIVKTCSNKTFMSKIAQLKTSVLIFKETEASLNYFSQTLAAVAHFIKKAVWKVEIYLKILDWGCRNFSIHKQDGWQCLWPVDFEFTSKTISVKAPNGSLQTG